MGKKGTINGRENKWLVKPEKWINLIKTFTVYICRPAAAYWKKLLFQHKVRSPTLVQTLSFARQKRMNLCHVHGILAGIRNSYSQQARQSLGFYYQDLDCYCNWSKRIKGKTFGTSPVGVSIPFLEQLHCSGMKMGRASGREQVH